MRSTPKILLMLVVLIAAIAGTLIVLRSADDRSATSSAPATAPSTDTTTSTDADADAADAAIGSEVWAVGDTWTVQLRQDAGAITPDGDTSVTKVPFRFEVVAAPKTADGAWKVHIAQDGAEGPSANGWNLEYVDKDGVMTLHRVAAGKEPPLEAELATIVLGAQFPYEVKYSAPPKDKTVNAEKLLDRAELPPGELPQGGTPGTKPPARADGGGLPTAPPLDD